MEYHAPHPRVKSTVQFTQYDQQMHVCMKFISRAIHHQHVSIVVETIFMVTYRNIRNANSLSKSTSEVLGVTKNVLNYLRSLDIYIYIYIYIYTLGFV